MKSEINKWYFSCVLDYTPGMAVQTFIWLTNLISIGVDPKSIFVHIVNEIPEEFLSYLNSKQVKIIRKAPFDERNKYCNKLVQLYTFNQLEDFDYVFLMDCDTAVVNLDGLELHEDVYAKVVDFPNPPLKILERIFSELDFSMNQVKTSFPLNEERITDWNNCNGGLYVVSKAFLNVLKPAWEKYALWCIDNANLFGKQYDKHADQVGFALAMASLNKQVMHLGIEWNYPIHVQTNLDVEPKIIHFHGQINEHLQLKPVNGKNIKDCIDLVNKRINSSLKESLSNSLFWNYRYLTCMELGSGVGSRGEILELKKSLIKHLTYAREEQTLIDVGCGDLELMKDMPFNNYLGLDVSDEAVKLAKQKRPDWRFMTGSITDESIKAADITMCFDVLIHQSNPSIFKNIIKGLVDKAKTRVIIGAYNEAPAYASTITHFHNAIFDEVKQYGKFNELAIVKKYRDVSVLVGTIYKNTHQRDLSSAQLNKAFKEVQRPDLLQYLVDVSRHHLGFYTAHYPRVFEYTWLLEQLEGQTDLRILDLGAGVCPLPLCLTDMGMQVTTVDSHPTKRLLKDKAKWNEWGFLNYSVFDKKIASKQCDFTKLKTLKKFDCIYSISVIEHMPQKIRLKMLKKAARLLKKGGELLLTIDVAPNTNDVWNYSEGKQVESQEVHGTMESFKKELKACGFEIITETIQREIYESRTDVWYVKSVLKRKRWL